MSGVVIAARHQYDPRNYARCERCGHDAGNHSTTACRHGRTIPRYENTPECDCPGWKRDEGWPPPEYIEAPR